MRSFRSALLLSMLPLAVSTWAIRPSTAQTPETITHQGVLEDPDGNPISGNVVLTFSMYDVETGGAPIWQELQGIELEDGLFTAALGSVEPFDTLRFTRPYWLGISVNSGDELEPRLPLSSVPYSLAARTLADSALVAGANVTITRNADNALVISATDGGEGDGHSLDAFDGVPGDAVFVDAEGRVGIGTTNPTFLLDVFGTNYKARYGSGGNVDVLLNRASSTNYGNLQFASDDTLLWALGLRGVSAADGLFFHDEDAGVSRMMIDGTSGNVGIATTAPNTLLHVNGTGVDNDGTTAVVRIVSGNGAQNLLLDGNEIDATVDGLFLNNNSVGNVVIANGGGNVGIGATFPGSKLTVTGTVESTADGFKFPDGTVQTTAAETGTPGLNAIDIGGGDFRVFLNRTNRIGSETFGIRSPILINNDFGGMYVETNNPSFAQGKPFYGYAHNGSAVAWHYYDGATNDWALVIDGNLRFRVDDDTGNAHVDGSFNGGGADLAESFAVEGLVSAYEPGDVLVISTSTDRRVEKGAAPYSTLVVGVYATKPGVVLSEYGIDGAPDNHVPMAVLGVVPTNVTIEGGPIRRGDLLVTSSTPGYAMKADPQKIHIGMVLGKALENFEGNVKGRINVLINVK